MGDELQSCMKILFFYVFSAYFKKNSLSSRRAIFLLLFYKQDGLLKIYQY